MISELSDREKAALSEVKAEIGKKYLLRWMKLFGSKARRNSDEESDIADCLFRP